MSHSLDHLFDKMNQLRILVIGDVMADAYIRGKVERISPEAPVPVLNTRNSEVRLGGAANVAMNLLALGAQVTVCALVGDDEMGQKLIRLMEEAGMHTDGIVVSGKRPTTVKTRIIAGGQHLLRIDEENDYPTFEEEKTQILAKVLPLVDKADAIIFEDYDKGFIFKELIEAVVEKAKTAGLPVTVDPKKRNFLDYKEVTLFKPNLKELKEGLKIEVNVKDLKEVEKACDLIMQQLGASHVLLTLSEHGMAIRHEDQFAHIPAMPRDIADVSGAGDTVISVATICLAAGCDLKTTLTLANMAGGLVCELSGVVPVNKGQLLAEAQKIGL